jgi:hypothetical protein
MVRAVDKGSELGAKCMGGLRAEGQRFRFAICGLVGDASDNSVIERNLQAEP